MAFFSRHNWSGREAAELMELNRSVEMSREAHRAQILADALSAASNRPAIFSWAESPYYGPQFEPKNADGFRGAAMAAANYDHAYSDNPSGILLPKAEAIVRTEAEMWSDIEKAKDDALASAKKIIDEAADAEEREYLDAIIVSGLVNAKGFAARKAAYRAKEKTRELATSIEEYGQIYPMNKFITEQTIEMICKKYNLYFTEAKKFIGEIPPRCLREIANFKVRRMDRRRQEGTLGQHYLGQDLATEMIPGRDMSVMAPMSELNYREGYDQKRAHVLYDDPIILQPVNGGFLIVTSWGKEAADAAIANPNHN